MTGSLQGRSALRRMQGADMPTVAEEEGNEPEPGSAPEMNSSAGAGVCIATVTERKQRKKKMFQQLIG